MGAAADTSGLDVVAFVAGATGYTGREVVRELTRRGARTLAHVRPDASRRDDWRDRFAALGAEVDTTPWEEPLLAATLSRLRPTHVFALLGTTRARAAAERRTAAEGYVRVDYGLSAMLLRAAIAAGSRPRFVYLSAAGVRAGRSNPYLAVRWRLEEELRASGLPYVIARPSFITGADRDEPRPGERAAAAAVDALAGVVRLVGARRIADRYRSTTNVALARALVRLALDPGATAAVVESEALR